MRKIDIESKMILDIAPRDSPKSLPDFSGYMIYIKQILSLSAPMAHVTGRHSWTKKN